MKFDLCVQLALAAESSWRLFGVTTELVLVGTDPFPLHLLCLPDRHTAALGRRLSLVYFARRWVTALKSLVTPALCWSLVGLLFRTVVWLQL